MISPTASFRSKQLDAIAAIAAGGVGGGLDSAAVGGGGAVPGAIGGGCIGGITDLTSHFLD